jgi:hypothetical protein
MTDECSWCIALGHDWDTWPEGSECDLGGHKKFNGFCAYHGNWWSDVKPGHYRCPECKIEAKNEERDGPYKIGDVFLSDRNIFRKGRDYC